MIWKRSQVGYTVTRPASGIRAGWSVVVAPAPTRTDDPLAALLG